ncbi:hypothetical protein ACNKHR_15365 [Shigella flexneri]
MQKNRRWCSILGLNQAATIQQKLIEHGMPGEMPVAIVKNGNGSHAARD